MSPQNGVQVAIAQNQRTELPSVLRFALSGFVALVGLRDQELPLASGPDGKIHISEDGDTWITRRLPVGSQSGGIVFAAGKFFIPVRDENGSMICSTNGFDWRGQEKIHNSGIGRSCSQTPRFVS